MKRHPLWLARWLTIAGLVLVTGMVTYAVLDSDTDHRDLGDGLVFVWIISWGSLLSACIFLAAAAAGYTALREIPEAQRPMNALLVFVALLSGLAALTYSVAIR